MWQYVTLVQFLRNGPNGTVTVWLPITFRGPAGQIYNRDRITQIALQRAGQFLGSIQEYERQRGRSDTLTGNVQIVGVTWIR